MTKQTMIEGINAYMKPGLLRRRLIMTVAGVSVGGASVAFFRQAAFGTDPFQCMCNGLFNVLPFSFGTLYTLINIVLLAVAYVMDKHYIGLATFINLLLLGYITDGAERILVHFVPSPDMAVRILFLLIGVVMLCIASAVYFTADLGVSTYDAIALHLADRKIAPFRFIRIATDLICVLIGFVLGDKPGLGTILTAFFMGPLISYFRRTIAEPMLRRGLPEKSAAGK